MLYGFAVPRKLTQDSQIEFGAQGSCRQQILGLAHQISPIVLGGGGELVNVLGAGLQVQCGAGREALRGSLINRDNGSYMGRKYHPNWSKIGY